MSTTIRVGAVDRHPVVLAGLGATLSVPGLELVAVAASVEELLVAAPGGLDVVLLDLPVPDRPPVERSVAALVARGIAVLVFTAEDRPVPVRRAVAAGASGLVLKADPLETIAQAVRDAFGGRLACSGPLATFLLTDAASVTRLSPRQVEILDAVSTGRPYRLVARELGIGEATVREHLARATQAYRESGVETGNVHGLISRARAEGHLER